MDFGEKDFDIFAESDEDACPACITGECNGKPVSPPEYEDYYERELKVKLEPKFRALSLLIVTFLDEHFDITLKDEFETPSKNPKKRPLCYVNLTQTKAGTGQTNAQFNLRLSYDRRPDRPQMTQNDIRRYRKFGIKFALHDKCRRTPEKNEMRNRDLPILTRNVRSDPERFLKLLRGLKDDFLIYKNMWEGIQPDCLQAHTISLDQLGSLFPSENPNDVPFQEIHRSLYWDKAIQKQIISDQNKLAAECVKTILRLYPFFLYATITDSRVLSTQLDVFNMKLEKNKNVLNCSRISYLKPEYASLAKGKDPELQRHFKRYIYDATRLSICDLYLGVSKELPQTILELCKMVRQKNICKVIISIPRYHKLKYSQRKNISEYAFEQKIHKLRNDIVDLGFRNRLVELDREHFDNELADRLLKTDKWTITEQTGHPIDFIGPNRMTNKRIRLTFDPIADTKFD